MYLSRKFNFSLESDSDARMLERCLIFQIFLLFEAENSDVIDLKKKPEVFLWKYNLQ